MEDKIHKLKIREVDRPIFELIKSGEKKVETRAATNRYRKINKGDNVIFICGKDKISRKVKNCKVFKDVRNMLKEYNIEDIAPHISTKKELGEMYYSFPDYHQKIKKFGLIAFELG